MSILAKLRRILPLIAVVVVAALFYSIEPAFLGEVG